MKNLRIMEGNKQILEELIHEDLTAQKHHKCLLENAYEYWKNINPEITHTLAEIIGHKSICNVEVGLLLDKLKQIEL